MGSGMRFALFGAGRVGQVHADNIAVREDAELACVYDVDRAVAARLTARAGGEVATSPDEIWADTTVDAVLIASSTDTHVDLLRGAVQAGKAAYCEKPIDISLTKATALARDLSGSQVPVFLGFRRRFVAELQVMRRQIGDGDIGAPEIVQVMARDLAPPPLDYLKVSGGLVRDKMVHYLDLVCWLLDDAPVAVQASGSCVVDPAIGDFGDVDTAVVTLRMASGALCQITNGRRSAIGVHERLDVYGADGVLTWDPRALGETTPAADRYFRQETFAAALDAFVRGVRAGTPMAPALADGLRAQIIADAATAALASGDTVAIDYGDMPG